MRWAERLLTWAGAGAPPGAQRRPARAPARGRYSDPLAFTIDLAADLRAAWLGQGAFAPRVSRTEALSVPAVKRVRDLICATIGTLELTELDPLRRPVPNELLDQPEPDVARSVTYTMTAEDMLFEEHAWWRVLEFTPEGWPRKVRRLEARSVLVQRTGKVYVNSDTGATQGMAWELVPDSELIRFDSPWPALLTYGARTIRDAMAVARAATRNVENPVPQGYFSPKSTDGVDAEDPPEVQDLLDDWRDAVDTNATPYLNGALEFHQVQFSPEQLQFKDTRDAVVLEIARLGNIDPEELGVSTTTRTYANAEQRRLDLLDFTVAPLLVAMQDRLKMGDVTFPGNRVQFLRDGFLKSDTLTRMQVYATGRQVGAYDDERIAEAEGLPAARVRKAREAAAPAPAPAPAEPSKPGGDMPMDQQVAENRLRAVPAAGFSAPAGEMLGFTFDLPEDVVQFRVDRPAREVSGLVIPWNTRARSGGYTWEFAPNSLHWSADTRVKMDRDHGYGTEFGVAKAGSLRSSDAGLAGSFKVARSAAGDEALNLAEDGVYDGLSAFVTFDGEGDGYEPHPDDPAVRRVYSATLRKVALTAMPAFDDARVDSVAATRNGDTPVTAPAPPAAPPAAPAAPPAPFDPVQFAEALTAGLGPAIGSAVVEAIRALPSGSLVTPTRQVVPAGGGARVTREAPVYMMNGQGASFVRDAWRSRTQGDLDARDRLLKFEAMTTDMVQEAMADPASFALTTGNAGALIPPGFRPDLYVSQLLRGRPITNLLSRGTIADASPFKIPTFVSSSGATATHVEGTNPSDGSLSVSTITVSPGGISGKYTITREIADSSNPAIDAIATQAMSESWSQQTEGLVYAKLNGAEGVGGTITSGFVPSGAQASAVTDSAATDQGRKFLAAVRQALALYPFRRFGPADWAILSQEGTTTFAGAVDTAGRPLLPWVGPQNTIGTGNSVTQGYFVDGLTFQPAWSMSGNTSGDADVIVGNRNDAWCWESPVLNFRFEEVSGPANVVLALFGYFACEVLRPVGLSGVRLTVS